MVLMAKCLPGISWDIITMTPEFFIAPFQYDFMIRALIVCILVGIMCPLLGAFVINRDMAFMGDAMGHSVLPGLVVSYAIGVSPFIGSLPMGIIVALAIGYIVKRTRISTDTSIGIVYSGLFAIGLIMLSLIGGTNVNLEDLLLGHILSTSTSDVYLTMFITVFLSLTLALFYKQMVFVGFDFQGAKVAGVPAARLDYLLLVLISISIVMSLQVVGVILVVGMLITPAAAASLVAKRFPRVIVLGILFGIISSLTGLYMSYHFNLPSGPSIAIVSSTIFGISVITNWLSKRQA